MKFLSAEIALYLYKLAIRPCIEYYCHVRAGDPNCYLEILDKPQKRMCRTGVTLLVASIEAFAYVQNVASLSFFL